MAQTKVSLIKDGVIVVGHLHTNHGITTDHIGEGSSLYFTDARVMTSLGSVSTHIIPDTDITYDLGSPTNRFRDLYLSGNTIYIGDTTTIGVNASNEVEIKDTQGNLKRLVVSEIDFVDSVGRSKRFKIDSTSGRLATFDSAGTLTADKIDLSANSTTDLSEGSNLYYTDARVGTYLTTNSYATQVYVNQKISDLVASAPTTLDTLNELAAALGDDPNFATTVSGQIGTKWTQDNAKITNWDTAYGWGNHASVGYLTTVGWNDVTGKPSTFTPSAHNHDDRYYTETESDARFQPIGSYLTSYTETSTLDSVADRGRSTNQQLISTNPAGFRVDSGSYARIELDSTDNWSYVRLQDQGVTTWDIACYNSGNLEWRPGGGEANRMTLSQSGYLTINGSMKVVGGVIDMNNNDGFVYDDGSNIMYVKLDGTNREIIHSANIGSQSVNYANSAGNADTVDGYHESSFFRDNQDRRLKVLRFTGEGGDSGNSSNLPYAIYQEGGAWSHPFPDLRIAMHTGIKFGANASYNGMRFYTDYDMTGQVMSVNNGSDPLGGGNVYVNNSLQAGSSLRAPIFYDSNNTGRYLDPTSTSVLGGINMNGTLNMQNYNITNINHLTFNDPGSSEGIEWLNGNGWKIFESPDGLTNAAGNLQFVTGSTRRMTLNTSGALTVDRIHVTEINDTDVWEGSITINGDAATYYPVGWYGGSQAEVCEIEIFRNYSETAPSSWNTSSHKGGLVCKLRANFGGWGGVSYDWVLEDFRETYSTMVAWAGHFANSRAFGLKLRGGGAIYHVRIKGRSVGPTVTLGTWDPGNNGSGIGSTTSVDSTLLSRKNHVRGNYLYSYGEQVAHLGSNAQTKSGTLQSNTDFRAPIFYDSNDTNSYFDADEIVLRGSSPQIAFRDKENRSVVLHNNSNRFYVLGAPVDSKSYAQINGVWPWYVQLDTNNVYTGNIGYAGGSYRAPIFYDSDNTGYYTNPAGTSYLYDLDMPHLGNGTENIRANIGGQENWRAIALSGGPQDNVGWGIHGSSRSVFGRAGTSIHFPDNGSFRLHTNGWDTEFEVEGGGEAWLKGGLRALKFYDRQDTSCYLDLAGSGRLNGAFGFNTAHESTVGVKIQGGSNGSLALKLLGGGYSSTMAIETPTYGSGISFTHTGSFNANFASFKYGANSVGYIQVRSTSTLYSTSSDYRLKENLVEITDGIERVKLLKPKRFNFIGHEETVDGFLAHEAQEVVPEAVAGEKDGVDHEGNPEYQGIDQAKLVPLLTAALQEAIAKIESLESRIQVLENQ